MDYLPIEKEDIPYTFEIELAGEIFTFEFHYNERFDFFTVDLSNDNEPLVYGEKIVFNQPLFSGIADERFPKVRIIPKTEGEQMEDITYSNFYETVFLAIEEL